MASIQAKLIQGMFRLIGVSRMLDKTGSDFDALLGSHGICAGGKTIKKEIF